MLNIHHLFRLSSTHAWLLLLLIALISGTNNLISPCLISIRETLNTSDLMLQVSFALGPALAIFSNIIMGVWSERYRRRALLLTSVLSFLAGSLMCAVASNIGEFLAGRSLQIWGDAGVSIVAFAIFI